MLDDRFDANSALLALSENDLGIKEWPGAKHNPAILAMGVPDDETPWCAAYINSRLAMLGIPHAGKLNARSYQPWGAPVELAHAIPGDIVVFWRGSPESWQGHVAILVAREGDEVIVRGGNQGNAVSDARYPVSRIVAIRRWDGVVAPPDSGRPVLRRGNRAPDPFVTVLQEMLAERGFFSGTRDGLFGQRTGAAVLAFQDAAGLTVDGIVGPATWAALSDADVEIRPLRDVSESDLRQRGSRTIAAADDVERVTGQAGMLAKLTAGAGALWGGAASLDEAERGLAQAETVMEAGTRLLMAYWPLLVLAGLVLALMHREAILARTAAFLRELRTEDAQTGANDKL